MVRDFFERHRVGIFSFVAVVMPLFLLYVHGRSPTVRKTTIFEVGLMTMTSPVQEAASDMLSGVDDVWSGYIALADVEKDNERLRREAALLTNEALRAKKLEEENHRLRQLLSFKRSRAAVKTVGAHVIGQDVSPFSRVVRIAIDAGTSDGVNAGAPVLAAQGLVGRISRITGRYAEVMLTVDARSSVSVRVVGKNVTGNLQGTGATDAYTARLLYLQEGKEVAIGDTLVTTGHDKVFPPGLEVGYIRTLEERQRGLYFELQVAPAVNFAILEEVLVVVGDAERTEEAGLSWSETTPKKADPKGGE
ncbi:MAG: rod shape-determining protein MreC [Myxococcota bacterium]